MLMLDSNNRIPPSISMSPHPHPHNDSCSWTSSWVNWKKNIALNVVKLQDLQLTSRDRDLLNVFLHNINEKYFCSCLPFYVSCWMWLWLQLKLQGICYGNLGCANGEVIDIFLEFLNFLLLMMRDVCIKWSKKNQPNPLQTPPKIFHNLSRKH